MNIRVYVISLAAALALPLYADDALEEQRQVNQLLSRFPAHCLPSDADLRTVDTFLDGIRGHVSIREKSDKRNIVMITHFCGSNVLREFFLSGRGEEEDYVDMVNWAIQDTHTKQLSRAELTELHQLLKDLPEKSVYPPLDRLIFISFESGHDWIHRFYDLQNEPAGLKRIFEIFQSKMPE